MRVYVEQKLIVKTNKWGFKKNEVVTVVNANKIKRRKEYWITVLRDNGDIKEIPKKYLHR